MEQELEKLLANSQLRITKSRKAIFQTLKITTKPLSQAEIATLTPAVDRGSVYRTIELFLKLGIIVSITYGWRQRFELAAPFRPHHHHLHCVNCDKTEEIQSEYLEGLIHKIASTSNFRILGHTFEVMGICRACAQH